MDAAAARTALEIADWRRRVFALYGAVRTAASPRDGHALWRHGRDELMSRHPATPLLPSAREGFTGLPVAEYDPAWRFEARVRPTEPHRLEVATATDGIVPFDRIGVVELPDIGRLDVWRLASYGGGIFVPLRDALAGTQGGTYGGGRYLIDTIKGADLGGDPERATLTLDFNFAYNPSCAYDPAWACPLPPPGNVLAIPVPVGERYGD